MVMEIGKQRDDGSAIKPFGDFLTAYKRDAGRYRRSYSINGGFL
jgi:hypothetical protein